MSRNLPDVAVVLITYNHEAFIAQSIKSVFAQEYPGKIKLVVSDDCSTDRTQEIIAEVISSTPPHVAVLPILRRANVGGFRNLSDAWESANKTESGYLALLEGDDYWTDPCKLASQVTYMEAHSRTAMSFGLAVEVALHDGASRVPVVVFVPPSDRPTFRELLGANFIETCTVVYRQGVLPHFPAWFAECPFRDWPLHLAHASAGEIHYLDRVVGVHRQHRTSRWWNPSLHQRERVEASETVQRLAVRHLGAAHEIRGRYLAARRQLWRAEASGSRSERWLRLAAAFALQPRLLPVAVRRRARRRAANRRLELAGSSDMTRGAGGGQSR